jgi:hypothetical protein
MRPEIAGRRHRPTPRRCACGLFPVLHPPCARLTRSNRIRNRSTLSPRPYRRRHFRSTPQATRQPRKTRRARTARSQCHSTTPPEAGWARTDLPPKTKKLPPAVSISSILQMRRRERAERSGRQLRLPPTKRRPESRGCGRGTAEALRPEQTAEPPRRA